MEWPVHYLFTCSSSVVSSASFVYRMTNDNDPDGSKKAAKKRKKKKGEEQDHENKFRKTCDEHFRTYRTDSFVLYVSVFLLRFCLSMQRIHMQNCRKAFLSFLGKHFLDNLKSVANDGSFPMFRGIINSVIVSGCSAALCTYFFFPDCIWHLCL